jgi:hypothetical protein
MTAITTAATQANKNALMMTDFLFSAITFFIRFLFLAGLTGQLVSTITK